MSWVVCDCSAVSQLTSLLGTVQRSSSKRIISVSAALQNEVPPRRSRANEAHPRLSTHPYQASRKRSPVARARPTVRLRIGLRLLDRGRIMSSRSPRLSSVKNLRPRRAAASRAWKAFSNGRSSTAIERVSTAWRNFARSARNAS